MNNLLGRLRKTIQDETLIQPNDRVVVGLSGGKDSMALLYLLNQYSKFSPTPFHLEAMTIDLGFDNFNLEEAHQFCDAIKVPYSVIKADIKHFIKTQSIPVLKSPCPMDRRTKREDVSLMLKEVYKTIPNSRKNMLTAMRNAEQCNLFQK